MPHKSLTPIHQSFWVLKQLHHGGNPEHFVNFRTIHNVKPFIDSTTGRKMFLSEPTFDTFVKIKDIPKVWNESLLATLSYQNFNLEKPANVYFAINPLTERGHKKEFFAGFCSFYLDMDDHGGYTKERRWSQIYFLTMLGFKPSFVIDSGHGYHLYYCLTRMLSREEGEPILKMMVARTGCKAGGNTFDISRVFRLPGFFNVKSWHLGDKPPCGIIVPSVAPEELETQTADRFDPEKFYAFPPAELSDLQRYYDEARRQSANNPAEFESKVKLILDGAKQAQQQYEATQAAVTAGTAIAVQNQIHVPTDSLQTEFTPKFTVVPAADEIKWGKGEGWMKKYCKLGHHGLTQGELDALVQKNRWKDSSASALDFMVIYALAKKGYTEEAVREFWLRPANQLHRADKEAKNPNYFAVSYAKALEYVKAAHAQATKPSEVADKNKIVVSQFQTFITTEDGLEPILTAELKLNEIYIDEDADQPNKCELYDIDIIYVDPAMPEGVRTKNQIIPHSAFCDIKEFRCHCSDMFCCLTSSTAHLQHLIRWLRLTYRTAKSRTFHSKIVFKNDRYIFPQFSITKDAIIRHDSSAMNTKITKHIPMLDHFKIQFVPQEQIIALLKEHWLDTLQIHLPRLVASTLGFFAAGAIAPLFEQQLCIQQFHIPTINIRGPSSTAKTETVKHLCTMTGISYGKNVHSVKSSDFALTQLISSTNYLPIVVDEFKEEEGNSRNLADIRQLFRRMYSGEAIIKGRRDLSVVTTQIHGGLIIIGELALERAGNIAEVTRILPINSDGFDPSDTGNIERWKRSKNVSWCELGPLFYQFILQQNAVEMHHQFEALTTEVEELIKNSFAGERYRIASNLAVIWFGCRLIDKFIQSLWPEAPTIEAVCNPKESLVKYLCEWSKESGHSMKYTVTKAAPAASEGQPATVPTEDVKIVADNELLTVIRTYGLMIETGDKLIREIENNSQITFHEHVEKGHLYLPFQRMYNTVNIFYHQQNRDGMPALSKLQSLIHYAKANKSDWIVASNYGVHVRGGNFKALVLNVRMLRQMGVWPARAFLSQDSSKPPVESSEIDKL
jgi:hypothetical protein